MKKKIIISIFITIIILQAIMPIKMQAFNENREIISIPARIENQKTGEVISKEDTLAGLFLEPTVELFTIVIDAIMEILTGLMTQKDFELVMLWDLNEVQPLAEGVDESKITPITLSKEDMEQYKRYNGAVEIQYPNFTYSPEEIFAGKIDLLDINFIDDSNKDDNWNKIRNVVSDWYKVFRMITIIGLLSVLIYTGIKIIITSNTKDKAKYKELILNWFIAVCLAFSMHYIMAFILSVVEQVTGLLDGICGLIKVDLAGETTFITNLIGFARFQMQQVNFSAKVGHLIIYTALVTYTFKFTFTYLKRVLNMAFLTVISPIVALTYPIDKMNDGKAKGFEMWLKEYIYNALLQPMHYILYYILVTSSLTLAVKNPIYGIAALMFVSNAEKLLKRIFGFNKASGGTVGGVAGAFATGAITSSIMNMVRDPLHPLNGFFGGKFSGSSGGSRSNQLGSSNNDDYEPSGIIDDINWEDYTSIDMSSYTPTNNFTNNVTSNPSMPLVDDYINRYRQGIPLDELGELTFDDGLGTMVTLLRRIYECEKKLEDSNLSESQRQKIEERLFRYKGALQARISKNEAGFIGTTIPQQYTDGDTRTNSQLADEIRRLWALSSDMSLSQEERNRNGQEAKKLLKRLNKRMAENQYINGQGGPKALLEQERLRMLTNELEDEINPVVNGNTGARRGGQRFGAGFRHTSGQPITSQPVVHQPAVAQPNPAQPEVRQQNPEQQEGNTGKLKDAPVIKGIKNVGKTLIKPVIDTEKDFEYNTTRLVGNILKTAAGVTAGIGAAAVQAGISITDGKYNALEGVGTIGAGIAGASSIARKSGGLVDAYKEGAYSEEDKQSLEYYSKQWYNRDDIISNYNREFPGKGKDMRRRAVNNYVSRGITDFEEQKQAIKFAELLKQERGMNEEEADWVAAGTLRYRQNLLNNNNYDILFDQKKREKYINSKVDTYLGSASKDSVRRTHNDFLQNIMDFDRANR